MAEVGLTTYEALSRLHKEFERVVNETSYVKHHNWKNVKNSWIRDSLHHTSRYTTISWISALALITASVCLSIGSMFGHGSGLLQVVVILILVVASVLCVLWDNRLRHAELLYKAEELLTILGRTKDNVKWTPEYYPHLCTPASPCITLQLTYRDGDIVNLPWALLVRGDVIVMRPGQVTPGLCTPYQDPNGQKLYTKEIYSPSTYSHHEPLSAPTARAPLENKMFILEETPYLSNLRLALEQSLSKPVTYFNKERYLIMVKCIEFMAMPTTWFIVLMVNTIHYLYLSDILGRFHWTDLFLIQPINVILPLLPLVFPIYWFVYQCYGTSRVRATLDCCGKYQKASNPYEDEDTNEPMHLNVTISFDTLKKYFIDAAFGREFLCRCVNFLHVLGSVTVLCCVDKKGILSWPNPTAEKVFFLRNSDRRIVSNETLDSREQDSGQEELDDLSPTKTFLQQGDGRGSGTVAEVLDLTHDHGSPFRLQFDDQSWKQYLSSLKPLGLTILLNTCNSDTQEHYMKFCSHINCEAAHTEDLVPVTNRRCLCELARQIGFVDQAQHIFHLEQQLCTFKHVPSDTVRKDMKFVKQLATKVKFPFPHMMASVVREKQSGCLQLMSQGTADVILDSCVEFWDGNDLCVLTSSDRKKIMDFYQRSSLTSYCTAFSYRPLSKEINSRLSQVYLELPNDSKSLYNAFRSPTPLAINSTDCKWKGILAQYHSTDSLLNTDLKEGEVSNIEGCFELQCNQVFIGMVTMQYQAQHDIVQLIEQLERACIRFVHFSKENELRSRVFSEKMGLESGWNCHISLLSERNSTNLTASRAMSFSAPSAINMEFSTVKFEDEWVGEDGGPKSLTRNTEERVCSEESILVQSVELNNQHEPWRSLSCLTDSTDQSVPVNFIMSNRAKLPRGIDKIRPHLELIDNVPLLVSLFTDCTPSVTREMLHIMQDYGEVVCVIGSSANCDNMGIFMQADASIAMEPLYPQVCQKVPVFAQSNCTTGPTPIELSRALNSISCPVNLRREDPMPIYHLVLECRHFMKCVTSCVQYWLCCVCSISFIQLLAVLLMLPALFTTGEILYLCCVLVPFLSTSLMGIPTDSLVMQTATGKNRCKVNSEISLFVLWCYGSKFIPSVFLTLGVYISTLTSYCFEISNMTNSTCYMVYSSQPEYSWTNFNYSLTTARQLALFIYVLNFVIISSSFVHRTASIFTKKPFDNLLWLFVALCVLIVQCFITTFTLYMSPGDTLLLLDEYNLPWFVFLLTGLSPIVVFAINEAVKLQEIKVNERYQRRKRLDFGTKLGMNSPF